MRIIYFILFIGVGFILFLSWRPDYDFKHLWFIPGWLSEWTDNHANGNIRTAVPFLFMGLCSGFLPSLHPRPVYRWLIWWGILVAIVIIAEAGQLLIPTRFFSFEDIGWGATGALVGIVISILITSVLNRISLPGK